jgi:hypothetical protein
MHVYETSMSWFSVRGIRAALEAAGPRRSPVLLEGIPQWNGSFGMAPEEAARALEELRRFRAGRGAVEVDRLIDDAGDVLAELPHGEADWFWLANPHLLGLSGHGTFCVWDGGAIGTPLFEAERFEQRAVDLDADGWPTEVELRDPAAGTAIRTRAPLRRRDRQARHEDLPRRLAVVPALLDPDAAYPVLAAMTSLFEASVATGTHVSWG